MALPLATEEPDDDFFETALRDDDDDDDDDDNRVGIHGSGDDNDEESSGLVFRTEPLTQDEFSGMSMEYHNETEDDYDYEDEERMCSGSFRNLVLIMVCVLIFAVLAVLVPGIRDKSPTLEALRTPARIPVKYDCPPMGPTKPSQNYSPNNVEGQYENVTKSITTNMTEFLTTFRDSKFDDWGKTYQEIKQDMRHFKSTYFTPYLQDGSTIYESACGIGLNLYMTLEILQEVAGIENLFVYGNEVVDVSAEKANAVYDHLAPALSRKGVICPANSAHLGFIPANSFDLVYTGYISPLLDPLNFGLETTADYDRYTTLCKSSSEEQWAEATLNEIAQSRQNEWYGRWVAEMARIAKPGVPVIVEQVSTAYCDAFFDWGGVRREWWLEMATNDTFGWNVDPSSLVIENDAIFRERYHVFMLKNGKRENI
jgi:hypothetical protein